MQDASGVRASSRSVLFAACAALVLALPARADVTVQERTVSSGLGGFGNGTTTATRIIARDKGREDEQYTYTGRLKTFAGKPRSTSTITRLDEELIWELDHLKQQYTELTFAEMREAMAKAAAQARAEKQQPTSAKPQQDMQVDFKVDVQRTGKRDRINGFDAEQWIITLTAVPKDGKSGETAGSYTIKLDGWYSTQVPGQSEVAAYYRRWAEKMGMDPQMRSMASSLMAMHGDAVREIAAKMKDMKGMAVRSTMTMDMGSGLTPAQQAHRDDAKADAAKARAQDKQKQQAKEDAEADANTAGSVAKGDVGGALGGFLSRKFGKAAEKKAESSMASGAGSGSGSAFTVTTDVLSVTTSSAGASFDVPAGYKKVERKQK